MKKIKRKSILFVELFLLCTLFMHIIAMNNGRLIKALPPASGDWIIMDAQSLSDTTLQMNGSILIKAGGSLTLSNVDIVFMMDHEGVANGDFNLTVYDEGELNMNSDSSITTDHTDLYIFIYFEQGSKISIDACTIEQIGFSGQYGMIVQTNNASITNSEFISDDGAAVVMNIKHSSDVTFKNNVVVLDSSTAVNAAVFYVVNATNLSVQNNSIMGMDRGRSIWIEESSDTEIIDNYLYSKGTTSADDTLLIKPACPNLIIDNNEIVNEGGMRTGILMSDALPRVKNITISNNIIYSESGYGIKGNKNANITIDNNEITSESYAIYLNNYEDGNLTITDNFITAEEEKGIYVNSIYSGDAIEKPIIANNYLNHSVGTAIYVDGLPTVIIDSNTIGTVNATTNPKGTIYVSRSNYLQILNNAISNTPYTAIEVFRSNHGIIASNAITKVDLMNKNGYGINATDSTNVTINANTITKGGSKGVYFSSNEEWRQVKIIQNTLTDINSNSIEIRGAQNSTIEDNMILNGGSDGIYSYNSTDLVIDNNQISETQSNGIFNNLGENITISNTMIENIRNRGIRVNDVNKMNIIQNILLQSDYGVYASICQEVKINSNFFLGHRYALYLTSSFHNGTIKENIIDNNQRGLFLMGKDNIIRNNTLSDNFYGIQLSIIAEDNSVFYNDFLNNAIQAEDYASFDDNEWSFYIGIEDKYYGNYWSDYEGEDLEAPFGHGDTPYNITGDIADMYPLMKAGNIINPPSISAEQDLTFYNDTNNYVQWSISSIYNPTTYAIRLNGTIVKSGTITNTEVDIIYTIPNLDAGNYTLKCTVTNKYGKSASDTIQLTVLYLEEEQQTITVTAEPEETGVWDFNFDYISTAIGIGAGMALTGMIIGIISLAKGGSKKGAKSKKPKKSGKKK